MTEINQTDATKPRLVGINHIALEVGDIDQAPRLLRQDFSISHSGGSGRATLSSSSEISSSTDGNPDAARGPPPAFRARRR